MSGIFRVQCDEGGEWHSFQLGGKFGALDAPDTVRRILEGKGWEVEQASDGSIKSAICPHHIQKLGAEEAGANRGEWPTSI